MRAYALDKHDCMIPEDGYGYGSGYGDGYGLGAGLGDGSAYGKVKL